MIRMFKKILPTIASTAYVDEAAVVIGDVHLGAEASVWPMAVIRGDVHHIRIGERTNVQDGAVLHVTHDGPYSPGGHALTIGDDVTIGHNATVHACTVGNRCLIGMNATVLDGAVLEDEVMVGANALVPPGQTLKRGFLYVGSPAKQLRELTDSEKAFLKYNADHYVELMREYRG